MWTSLQSLPDAMHYVYNNSDMLTGHSTRCKLVQNGDTLLCYERVLGYQGFYVFLCSQAWLKPLNKITEPYIT